MTGIAKCACGAKAQANKCYRVKGGIQHYVECEECWWSGPPKSAGSEAIAAWNRVMRTRPQLRELSDHFFLGDLAIGAVKPRTGGGHLANYAYGTEETFHQTPEFARTWLITKLTSAGFDVVESEDTHAR